MNPHDYGKVEISNIINEGVTLERFIVTSGNKTYRIDMYDGGKVNKVTILGNINLSWIDSKLLEVGEDIFKREINKSTIYFMDGEIVLRKKELPAKPFYKLNKESVINNEFVTMDIETITINNKVTPYLINSYTRGGDGRHHLNSYNENENELFKDFIAKLISQVSSFDSKKVYVYAHNLSTFDGVLILKHLFKFGKVKPILHNGRIISITFIYKYNGIIRTIIFKDSFLMLPSSLRKLCEAFNVESSKGYFPFHLNDITYTGVFPKYDYWTDITNNEWNNLKANFGQRMWSFKSESIKYCELDCVSLHEVLIKFNDIIFNKFNININSALTLPALAMRIYKTQFMPNNTIYQLLGKAEENIRNSYSGGAVDVYIPHNRATLDNIFKNIKGLFIKLYYYDVNSLYPYIMAKFDMPIGKPIFFNGDIRKYDSNAYGFFYCKITSPDNIKHPLLQRRIKTSNGMRTIAGLGSWIGWICSTEMDNAMKYGYTFEILKGYEFNKGNIFEEYVLKMYNLRQEYIKGHPMNLIAKLLMNSLYGKFGMKLVSTEILMYDYSTDEGQKSLHEDIDCWGLSIQDFVKIDDYFLIIRNTRLSYKYNEELDMFHGQDINIAIASAITAGARVHMSYFKNNPDFRLYYSDTDSAIIDRPLPSFMVGSKLGQLKLEHTIDKAVFLAPKVYGLVDVNGNEIIKIKGVTGEVASKLTINDLEELLIKDSQKEFTQEKWFKKVLEGEITTSDIVYTLKVTSNKRAPLYLLQGELEIYNSTRPYNYDELTSN